MSLFPFTGDKIRVPEARLDKTNLAEDFGSDLGLSKTTLSLGNEIAVGGIIVSLGGTGVLSVEISLVG